MANNDNALNDQWDEEFLSRDHFVSQHDNDPRDDAELLSHLVDILNDAIVSV